MDGNFSADHLKQKNPLDDVSLTSGEGMMTNQTRYKSYLAHPIATPQVSTFLTPFCSCGRGRGLPRRMLCGLLLPRASAAAGNHAGHDGRGHHLPRATPSAPRAAGYFSCWILILLICLPAEVYLHQPSGCQQCKSKSCRLRCDRHRCFCLCSIWGFHSRKCGRFSKGRVSNEH